MDSKSHAERISGGVFLIGLALLFTPISRIVGGWWPGILFVVGAAVMARGITEGQQWHEVTASLWMFGIGFIFLIGFNIPLVLILIGLALLFGYSFKPEMFGQNLHKRGGFFTEKPKHDEFV